MKVVSTQTVNGSVKIMYGSTSPIARLYRPSERISSNMPDSTATCGNIDTARIASSSVPLPLKRMRPERVGRGDRQQQRQRHRDGGDHHRVEQVAAEGLAALEQLDVVVPGRRVGQQVRC